MKARRSHLALLLASLFLTACNASTSQPTSRSTSTSSRPRSDTTVDSPVPTFAGTTKTDIATLRPSPLARASFADFLPHPDHSPEDPYANVPVVKMGTIRIPAIGLVHPFYEGVWLTTIDNGPGHWPGSAWPGAVGNAVFPGHRVTHSHPFIDLDRLRPGDEIIFDMANGTFTYRVRETRIVTQQDIWVVDQHANPEVTLIACHPKHSAQQRIVIKGDLVSSKLTTAASNAARRLAEQLLQTSA